MSNIEGKVIVITGASSGIGEATARLLAERGAHVVVGARRTERLEDARRRHHGSRAAPPAFAPSMSPSRGDVQAFVDFAKAEFGQVDVLINNAGVMPLSPWPPQGRGMGPHDRRQHPRRPPRHRRRAAGHEGARQRPDRQRRLDRRAYGGADGAVYCATKYAVWAISDGLRQENTDLRVTMISPGVVDAELGHDITDARRQRSSHELPQDRH